MVKTSNFVTYSIAHIINVNFRMIVIHIISRNKWENQQFFCSGGTSIIDWGQEKIEEATWKSQKRHAVRLLQEC